jgi:PAS domain S-box-containing protein
MSRNKLSTAIAFSPSSKKKAFNKTGFQSRNDILENGYKQLFDHSSDAIRIIKKDFEVLSINCAFAKMTGVNRNEVIGRKCWEVFPSGHCRTSECRLQQIISGANTIEVEIERKRKDGTTIPCRVSAFPLFDGDSELTCVVEIFRDITAFRRMEEQVEESEDRYKALLDLGAKIGESIAILQDVDDVEGKFIFVSERWSKTVGYSKKELLKMSFFQLIKRSDKKTFIDRYRREKIGETTAGIFEITVIRKNNVEMPIEITSAVTNHQGKQAVVIYMRDITERKKAEEQLIQSENRYHSLFDHAPVAIWEMDYSDCKKYIDALRKKGVEDITAYFEKNPDDLVHAFELVRTIDVNNANVAMNGAASKDELVNNVNMSLINTPGALRDFAKNTMTLVRGSNKVTFEQFGLHPSGEPRYQIVHISVAPGCEHTLSRVFFSMIDITDRKLAEEELKKYKNRLEDMVEERTEQLKAEIERRKQMEAKLQVLYETERRLNMEINRQMQDRVEFTRVLVHELKTPLTPILSSSDYMVEHIDKEPFKSFARQINNGALNLSTRIDELLDMAKGEIGLLKLVRSKINVREMLQECQTAFAAVAKERKIDLLSEIAARIPLAYADSGRVRQVIYNLVDNAIKNTSAKGKVILKGVVQDNKIIISVNDTGRGIAEKDCKYLFQPYRRLHLHKDKRLGGLGLGLSICKMMIELHGEKIWFDTRVGYGSTFYFTLPIYSAGKSSKGK